MVKYDPDHIREFYDRYGIQEWERLEKTAYGRLQFALQWHFVEKYLPRGAKVLDAGGGPGRFAVELARAEAEVVLLDISPVQLEIAERKLRKAGEEIKSRVMLIEGDICKLPFGEESFELTLAMGGPLSYVVERAEEALGELKRVTKRGGYIILSVMSNFGRARFAVKHKMLQYFREPEAYDLWGLIERGIQGDHVPPERRTPHRCKFYTSGELRKLLEKVELEVLELAAIPSISAHLGEELEAFAGEPLAWGNLLRVEIRLCREPGLLDTGEHILVVAQRL